MGKSQPRHRRNPLPNGRRLAPQRLEPIELVEDAPGSRDRLADEMERMLEEAREIASTPWTYAPGG